MAEISCFHVHNALMCTGRESDKFLFGKCMIEMNGNPGQPG
jgi:hypothetical protein